MFLSCAPSTFLKKIVSCLLLLPSIAYSLDNFLPEQKPIVVVIPSYNNERWYKLNLDSVLSQKYDNFRVIYIDDCSKDKTFQLVQEYIENYNLHEKVTLIRNEKRRGALANHYAAVHRCQDHEIVVQLDGDDWFKDGSALARFNKEYQDPEVWLTYGQWEKLPSDQPGNSKEMPKVVIKHCAYREGPWITSAPRTFYAGLFKQIKLRDFLDEGEFYSTSCDLAMMFPMLEMAGGRIKFISDVLYVYNCTSSINDYKTKELLQIHIEHVIRSHKKYKKVEKLPITPRAPQNLINVVVIADPSDDISNFLQICNMLVSGVGNIAIVYDGDGFKQELLAAISASTTDYVLLAHAQTLIIEPIDLVDGARMLEQTGGYGFYYGLGNDVTRDYTSKSEQRMPVHVALGSEVIGWQFKCGEFAWRNPSPGPMAMYRKADITTLLTKACYSSFSQLQYVWNNSLFDFANVGLCYQQAKVQ